MDPRPGVIDALAAPVAASDRGPRGGRMRTLTPRPPTPKNNIYTYYNEKTLNSAKDYTSTGERNVSSCVCVCVCVCVRARPY